jgi:2-phosphosulfolactate phosphatase
MDNWFTQGSCGVRFDWGATAATALAAPATCLVVVDVLSFTTSVSVAVEAGTQVFPYPAHDETAAAFARKHRAQLAAGHRAAAPDAPWTLSSAALRRAPFTARLVLPSPNGSAISAAASASGAAVIAACLRNAGAVGQWIATQGFGAPDRPVTVIAAGERWPDGSLRPALEDLLGAGAVTSALRAAGAGPLSPEAKAAAACFEATSDVSSAVRQSGSGQELIGRGFGEDVAIATELDGCAVVPVLTHGAFSQR